MAAKTEITILEVAVNPVTYTIPSFPVFSVQLRQIKWQYVEESGNVYVCDGFVRHGSHLNRTLPVTVLVEKGFSCMFLIEKEEFERCHNVDGLQLFNNEVLVLWKWCWMDMDDVDEESNSEAVQTGGQDDDQEQEQDKLDEGAIGRDINDIDDESSISHWVVFKCIGATRDMNSQEALSLASREMSGDKSVEVELHPEEDNPKNARAIAFRCHVDGKWQRIGYVVEEALDAVHDALKKNEILSVSFDWVKYLIHWSRSGPGWYAGIKITKKGEWPRQVVRSGSTK